MANGLATRTWVGFGLRDFALLNVALSVVWLSSLPRSRDGVAAARRQSRRGYELRCSLLENVPARGSPSRGIELQADSQQL
jgi:hypothetical protein